MRKITRNLMTSALALTIAFCGLNCANAANGDFKGGKTPPVQQKMQKPTPEQIKANMEKRVKEFNKALGLTDEQVAKAKEVRAQGHAEMKPLIEKKKAKLNEIRAVMSNDDLKVKEQDKKVEALRGELKEIDQDIRQLRRDNEKEFEAILTPEQKVKYAQIKEEGRKHFREHRRPMGPEMYRHPGHHGGVKRPPVEGPKPAEIK